ncbi:Ltp family lipoprotein [Mycolicibacterium elephantis]
MPAPGWYPDPSDPSRQRYFDGEAWTENYAPFGAPTPLPVQPEKPGMSTGLKVGLGVGAAVVALIVLGSIGNSDKDKTSSSSFGTSTTARTAAVAPTTTEPPMPDFTPGQRNAIRSAESYLDYTSFSKQGLIGQLESEQFSKADATFAVEYIESTGGVDWNEQAVKSAKSYLDYTSFSLQGLIDQLESEGFTPSQAQHGATTAYGAG